jgi:hypothetical protein
MSETSVSSQSSQSTTTPVQTIENSISNQISGVASGLAQQMVQFAQNTFAQTSQITNEAVSNFFQASQAAMGLSQTMINQYNTLFAPENQELIEDANSFASPARLEADMGMAGATAAQAGQAAEQNSIQQLQQFGIDPSSGRYASLINADNVQNAANVAGAENQQRVSDTATGQQLQAEAVQVGAQLPSSIANAENTGIAADTGAENAELANANTGVNLNQLPDQFLNTAGAVLKQPFSQGQSTSFGSGNTQKQSPQPNSGGGQNSALNSGAPNSGGTSFSGTTPNPGFSMVQGINGTNPNLNEDGSGITDPSETPGGAGGFDPTLNTFDPDTPGGEGGFDPTNLGSFGEDGSGITDPSASPGGAGGFDPSLPGSFGSSSGTFGNAPPPPTNAPAPSDSGGIQTITENEGGGSGGGGGTSSDDQQQDDEQDSEEDSGDGGGGGGDDFARGGPVPAHGQVPARIAHLPRQIPAGGRQVPASMSPSGGRKVDDVSARGPGGAQMHLNAHEFVIPQDVALWKGQEFFQNLINDSRKKRMNPASAPAKPTAGAK